MVVGVVIQERNHLLEAKTHREDGYFLVFWKNLVEDVLYVFSKKIEIWFPFDLISWIHAPKTRAIGKINLAKITHRADKRHTTLNTGMLAIYNHKHTL